MKTSKDALSSPKSTNNTKNTNRTLSFDEDRENEEESSFIRRNQHNKKSLDMSTNSSFSFKLTLFDLIIERIGFGYEQFIIIIVVGLSLMSQGVYFFLNGGMFIPIQKYYNVDDHSMGIASAMIYLSGIFISFSMGFLTNYIGRIRLIRINLILIVIFHIVLSLSNNFKLYCLCLFLIGGCINLNVPILTNILTEYLPVKNRALLICSIMSFYSIGNIFVLLVYWFIMPEYSIEGYTNIMRFLIIQPFITMIVGMLLLKDSPRSLIINENQVEGMRILSNMYKKSNNYLEEGRVSMCDDDVFTNDEKEIIINELISINKSLKYKEKIKNIGFIDILSKKYIKTTVLLFSIWILTSTIGFGPFFILPLSLLQLNIKDPSSQSNSDIDIIKSQIFISLIGLFSNPVGGILCEIKFLGRIRTGLISALAGFIIGLFILFDIQSIVFYIGILNISNTFVFNTVITYTSEIYPTYIRDYSSGIMNCVGNFGAMISQPMFILFNSLNVKTPYIFTTFFSLLVGILFSILPIETRGTELDCDNSTVPLDEKAYKDKTILINASYCQNEYLENNGFEISMWRDEGISFSHSFDKKI